MISITNNSFNNTNLKKKLSSIKKNCMVHYHYISHIILFILWYNNNLSFLFTNFFLVQVFSLTMIKYLNKINHIDYYCGAENDVYLLIYRLKRNCNTLIIMVCTSIDLIINQLFFLIL